jgi:hypothetical protein
MLVLYLCVLIVFLLYQESLKLILVDEPLPNMVLSQLLGNMATYIGWNGLAIGLSTKLTEILYVPRVW